jgi:hypothetical protein
VADVSSSGAFKASQNSGSDGPLPDPFHILCSAKLTNVSIWLLKLVDVVRAHHVLIAVASEL